MLSSCKLYSREWLQNETPSRRDGYDYEKELLIRKKCWFFIKNEHCKQLKLWVLAWAGTHISLVGCMRLRS